jgi:hypothetical protein
MSMRLRFFCLAAAVALGVVAGLILIPKVVNSHSAESASVSVSARLILYVPNAVNGQRVVAVTMDPGGVLALVTSAGDAYLYGLPGSRAPGLGQGAFVSSGETGLMAFSGDGREIAGVATDGFIWEWRPQPQRVWIGYASGVQPGLSFTQSASMALDSDGSLLAINTMGIPEIYRRAGDSLALYPVTYRTSQFHFLFTPPVFSGNGQYLAESGSSGIDMWNVGSGVRRALAPGCECTYAVLSDNLAAAVVSRGDFIQAWDLTDSAVAGGWLSSNVEQMAISSDGSVVAWTTGNNSIEVAYVHGGLRPVKVSLTGAAEGSLEFALEGHLLLATSGTGAAKVWLIGRPGSLDGIDLGTAAGAAGAAIRGLPLGRLAGTFAQGAGWGEIKPSTIFNGGDPTGLVSHITWDSWGGPRAVGTGMSDYVGPGQSVATGTQEPVTVVAFDVGPCGGVVMYRAVEWYFPDQRQKFSQKVYENVCAGTYVGVP